MQKLPLTTHDFLQSLPLPASAEIHSGVHRHRIAGVSVASAPPPIYDEYLLNSWQSGRFFQWVGSFGLFRC